MNHLAYDINLEQGGGKPVLLFNYIHKSNCPALRRTEHSNEPLKTKIVFSKGFHDF